MNDKITIIPQVKPTKYIMELNEDGSYHIRIYGVGIMIDNDLEKASIDIPKAIVSMECQRDE